jgi:hypothetical protein
MVMYLFRAFDYFSEGVTAAFALSAYQFDQHTRWWAYNMGSAYGLWLRAWLTVPEAKR